MLQLVVSVLGMALMASAAPPYDYNTGYGNYPHFFNGFFGSPYYHPYGGYPYGRDAYPAGNYVDAPEAYPSDVEAYPAPVYQAPQAYPAPSQPAYQAPAQPAYKAPQAPAAYPALGYIGAFKGSCKGSKDGLYYIDHRSFAFCSNEIKTIQNCPEASENPPQGAFAKPDARFCSINRLQHEEAYIG